MAAQTIGTNIVTDGSTEYELVKALLEGIGWILKHDPESDEARNLALLQKHLGMGGTLSFTMIDGKYLDEVKEALKQEGLPFITMPNDQGGVAVVIRDLESDKAILQECLTRCNARHTEFYKEISVQQMLSDIENDPRYKHEKIPVLTFEDNEMRLIASQKLFENDIVTSYENDKTIVHPSSFYGKSGDLVDVELDIAMEQAKRSITTHDGKTYDLLEVRKKQAKYDQETLSEFCKAYKEDKPMSLWDSKGESNIGLNINRYGEIELITPKPGYPRFSGENSTQRTVIVEAGDSINEIELFAILSKHANQIQNMVCCTHNQRDSALNGQKIPCARKTYEKNSPEKAIHIDISNGLQRALDAVKSDAYLRAEDALGKKKKVSMEDKAFKKEEIIIELLEDRGHPAIQSWLNEDVLTTDGTRTLLAREDKEKLLDTVISHFKDKHELSKDEMTIDYFSLKKCKEMFAYKGYDNDRNKSNEKEQFTPEQGVEPEIDLGTE